MVSSIPRWMDRQPVTTYYQEDDQTKPVTYTIQRHHCGICYQKLKRRGSKHKKVESIEIKNKAMITIGNKNNIFRLHFLVCIFCLEKYKLKSSEQSLNK